MCTWREHRLSEALERLARNPKLTGLDWKIVMAIAAEGLVEHEHLAWFASTLKIKDGVLTRKLRHLEKLYLVEKTDAGFWSMGGSLQSFTWHLETCQGI